LRVAPNSPSFATSCSKITASLVGRNAGKRSRVPDAGVFSVWRLLNVLVACWKSMAASEAWSLV